MTDVVVRCATTATGWECAVDVRDEDGSATRHRVEIRPGDLARLAPGAHDPTDLVSRSFAFLLAREPKESILRAFDLSVIGRYFPAYERTIRADDRADPSSSRP